MRFLVGADFLADPHSGAGGTVFHCTQAMREIGCEVDEFWSVDLGRRLRHGNLHYALELPRAMRRIVAGKCARKTYDVVLLSQPHAYLAGAYLHDQSPHTLFLNRSHGWEGAAEDVLERLQVRDGAGVSLSRAWLRRRMRARLTRHQDRVVEQADGIVAGSALIAQYLLDRYAYPLERVGVIPHGIPADYLSGDLPPSRPERWKKILYVGQFTPIKGPDQVARILNETLRRRPDILAGWVCDAAHHGEVHSLLEAPVRDRVVLYPWMGQDELKAVLDEYGLFLFPSWYEGCAKAPVEAMSRGLAVVSSRIGGPADRIRHGLNGFLFEPGESGAMGAQLEDLLDHPATAERIGRQARQDVMDITWTNHARQLVSFAERLLSEKRRGSVRA